MKTGLIGYGYWGPNLARNVINNASFSLACVCDTNPSRLNHLKKQSPWVPTVEDPNIILNDTEIECIIIATNPANHYELALKALNNGKHVLIEKPLATNMADAEHLLDLAMKKGLTLMVDHTFLYNGAVRKIKNIIEKNELGKTQYIDSTRINLGIFQNDINVLWDLATHDLSTIYYLLEERPISVFAVGKCHLRNGVEDMAYMTLFYNSGLMVHIHSSWSSPVKLRQMLIGCDKKMLVYNDIEPTEKIKLYDSGFILNEESKDQVLVDYRIGDVYIPKYDTTEALSVMIQDFYDSITKKKDPVANAKSAIEIINTLECAGKSIKQQGKEIRIKAI